MWSKIPTLPKRQPIARKDSTDPVVTEFSGFYSLTFQKNNL